MKKYNRWTFIKDDPNDSRRWICECECGTVKSVAKHSITSGRSKSCGCLRRSYIKEEGNKYGKLLVLEHIGSTNEGALFKCLCDCGNITEATGRGLRRGDRVSCGCSKNPDLIGKKFDRLTVLEKLGVNEHGKREWLCECECGTKTKVITSALIGGYTKSCGCLQREKAENLAIDIMGERFGKLVVVGRTKGNVHAARWFCECDCGGFIEASSKDLRAGDVKSCGCLTQSYNSYLIETALLLNNIDFKKEYTFEDLRSEYNRLLRFDFAIFKNNSLYSLIEYDGEQHFIKSSSYYSEEGIQRDRMKDNYCNKNNIPLLRIAYNEDVENIIKNFIEKLNETDRGEGGFGSTGTE